MLAGLVFLLAAPGGPARAQTPIHTGGTPDSVNVDLSAMDSLETRGAVPAAPDTARRLPHERRHSRFDQPHWVMLRSLAFPGWGQVHNRKWIKAGVVAAGEGYLIGRVVQDERALNRLQRNIDAAQNAQDDEAYGAAIVAYNARLDDSTRRKWFLGAALAYALLDAYVDAHFVDFEVEFDRSDPALPGTGSDPGARLKVRWHF